MLMLTNINSDNTYSITDSTTKELKHFRQEEIGFPVLGIFRDENLNITGMHCVQAEALSDCLKPIIFGSPVIEHKGIQNPDIQEFADGIRRIIPKYIFSVEASSTGKYHSPSAFGESGLIRHIQSVCRLFIYMTNLQYNKIKFSQREIDDMLVACMMHDFLKCGWDEDHARNKYTRHEHPLLAANAIRGMRGLLPDQDLELIAHCIESHMGEWTENRFSKIRLPAPSDEYQIMVHMADFLSSRNDITMAFDNKHKVYVFENQEINVVHTNDSSLNKEGTPKIVNAPSTSASSSSAPAGSKTTLEEIQAKLRDNLGITAKDREVLNAAKQITLTKELRDKFEITRDDSQVLDIFDSLLKYGRYSPKQGRYLKLAFAMTGENSEPAVRKLNDDIVNKLSSAVVSEIDMDKKEKLNIKDSNNQVRVIWVNMINSRECNAYQAQYLRLAL